MSKICIRQVRFFIVLSVIYFIFINSNYITSQLPFLRNEEPKQQFGIHSYYSDEMVFQSDVKNNIWGYIQSDSNLVTANYKCIDGSSEKEDVIKVIKKKKGIWMLELPPMNSKTICSVYIHHEGTTLTLNDVVFGDVWFCAGQSNMEMMMKSKKR